MNWARSELVLGSAAEPERRGTFQPKNQNVPPTFRVAGFFLGLTTGRDANMEGVGGPPPSARRHGKKWEPILDGKTTLEQERFGSNLGWTDLNLWVHALNQASENKCDHWQVTPVIRQLPFSIDTHGAETLGQEQRREINRSWTSHSIWCTTINSRPDRCSITPRIPRSPTGGQSVPVTKINVSSGIKIDDKLCLSEFGHGVGCLFLTLTSSFWCFNVFKR